MQGLKDAPCRSNRPPKAAGLAPSRRAITPRFPAKPNTILLPGESDDARPLVTLAMRGCSIKDRFDRSSTLAYNFEDGKNRLEFNLDGKGPTFSDPGRLEFKGVGVRFVHKFQNIKSPKERCRYESPVQGLVGSVYNEFYLRENDTVFQELHAKGVDFWN